MPVVVTGASGFVSRRAVATFVRTAPQVRCYVEDRASAEPLRRLGAKVAVGPSTDVDTLSVVMQGAHTACYLAGGLDLEDAGDARPMLESIRSALEAASRAGIRRFLFRSSPGASPHAGNGILRALGIGEEDVRGSGLEHVILRTTRVYGVESPWLRALLRWSRRTPALVVGPGSQVLAPVDVDDVARVLAAADDRDRLLSGTWGLQGPDQISADELCDLLAERPRRKVHLPPGRLARLGLGGSPRPTVEALELLAGDSLASGPDASVEFGVSLTSLREGLGRIHLEALAAGQPARPE